jgi:hypothetical protein
LGDNNDEEDEVEDDCMGKKEFDEGSNAGMELEGKRKLSLGKGREFAPSDEEDVEDEDGMMSSPNKD